MRLTQAKIERLLGMDCNTFCSIALIRQDAYGLFLEADSDRRMEVLSALLGLDVYTRMEELARAEATEQRRRIAATKERINILNEQAGQKAALTQEDEALKTRISEAQTAIESLEAAITAEERAEATRQHLVSQADAKYREGEEYERQAGEKTIRADQLQQDLDRARRLASTIGIAQEAAQRIKEAQAELEPLRKQEERYAAVKMELQGHQNTAWLNAQRRQNLQRDKEAAAGIMAQKGEIEAAQAALDALRPKQAEAKERISKKTEAGTKVQKAREAVSAFVGESRKTIAELNVQLANLRREAGRLEESGCPVADNATCVFMSSAVSAKAKVPALEAELAKIKTDHRSRYEELVVIQHEAEAEYEDLGDPYKELRALDEEEKKLRPVAGLAPQLAAAEAKITELENSIREAEAAQAEAEKRAAEIMPEIETLKTSVQRAEQLRDNIAKDQPVAATLNDSSAAAATVDAITPQIEELRREAISLHEKMQQTIMDAQRIKAIIPEDVGTLAAHRATRDQLRSNVTDWTAQRGALSAKLEATAEAEKQIAALRLDAESIAATLNDYTTLVKAFGLDGIQYMIIRGVVPEIMRQSNDILAAMTGGRMAVDFRTEKEQKSTKQIVNSLEVWISTIQGTVRPYLSHSGGEKVKIALAVTLGLADVKARRAGVQLGMLFIDEPPFLDADGTEAYADALTNMSARNPGMRILAISHDPTMKARFSQNIVVSAGEDGSTVTME